MITYDASTMKLSDRKVREEQSALMRESKRQKEQLKKNELYAQNVTFVTYYWMW